MSEKVYPLVSLLVANYNNGQFISETLESALAQTYPNIEIVIVDDGSTDDSLQEIGRFMESHPDSRLRLFKNADNKGCGRIKRQCIELSEGAYFGFLDPEDTILPDTVSTLMGVFDREPGLGIVYCTHYLCNEKWEIQGISSYPGAIPQGQSHLTSTSGHISAMAICRRAVYDKTEGINATYQVSEDQDLYLKMEEVAPVYYVDKPMYFYRKHDHNSSWNERKVFNNFYWKYHCVKAAYLRRKRSKSPVANITKLEMDRMSLSYYLRLGKERWRTGKFVPAVCSYIRMFPYLYTHFC
ncbi:MAG: glycosyltransferase family 2 protein [Bacteroidales bacterium]|nr:glycosyltransferase family 2 protein [Bacteroidales bacterium]